tara:strand:+ start:116 stop:1495 length:1380 start_codon:yes stop_codon:yes gene_type:complete
MRERYFGYGHNYFISLIQKEDCKFESDNLKIFDIQMLNTDINEFSDFRSSLFSNNKAIIFKDNSYFNIIMPENIMHREILVNRVFTSKNQTLEQLGQKHGVTRERIRQIEGKYFSAIHGIGLAIKDILRELAKLKSKQINKNAIDELIQYYNDFNKIVRNTAGYNDLTRAKKILLGKIARDIFNNYIIDKSRLSKKELLFADKVIIDFGGYRNFYNFNCPVSLYNETYFKLIDEFIEVNNIYPKNRLGKQRNHEGFLAHKISIVKNNDMQSENKEWLTKFDEWKVPFDHKKINDLKNFKSLLIEYKNFALKNKRLPSTSGILPNEKKLAYFRIAKESYLADQYKQDYVRVMNELEVFRRRRTKYTEKLIKDLLLSIAKEKLGDINTMPSMSSIKLHANEFIDNFNYSSFYIKITMQQNKSKTLSWPEVGKKYGFQKFQLQVGKKISVMNINDYIEMTKD